ncbi:MAG: hypothetical protein CMJ49_04450 [Planctomycetaceae bacterium]|nr:hypothetical protein [Planctomycetaceae bacterium]
MDASDIWKLITADKRKFGLVCTLMCVALLLWGRLLMKDVPLTATADDPTAPSIAGAVPTPPADSALEGWPVVHVDLVDEVSRDLFRPDPRYFQTEPEEDALSDDSGKSGPESDDEQDIARARQAVVREAAQSLSLQSTIHGNVSQALINGQLVSPGQSISGFTVVRVDERRVTVIKDGVEIVLEM